MKKRIRRLQIGVVVAVFLLSGCWQTTTIIDPDPPKGHRGLKLTVSYSDSIRRPELIEQFAREWSDRTGATVEVMKSTGLQKTDVVIVGPAELPALAASNSILPLPAAIFARDDRTFHYHWDGLLPMESQILTRWGRSAFGVPLIGEGHVMVYREDRFKAVGLTAPETWDDYVNAAKALTKVHGPSLPPLPKRADELDAEFHLIAACYDRAASHRASSEAGADIGAQADEIFSYQYRLESSQPRMNAPAFVRALNLLHEMRSCRPPDDSDDPAKAFRDGQASLCIATLADLASFQQAKSPVKDRFRIALVPGSLVTFDLQNGKESVIRGTRINRMPYLGTGGWMGAVRKDSENPQAALEFLTDFADPDRMGAEVITAAKWGAGPYRSQHLEERTRGLWLGYDLSQKETERLIDALKASFEPSLINHRYRLRLPNQAEHLQAFDAIVRPALKAEQVNAEATMREVNERWKSLWKGVPDSQKKEWIRFSCGLSSQE